MMSSWIDFEIVLGDLMRRLSNLLREGVIQEVDHKGGLVRVSSGDLLTDWLPYFVRRAGSSLIYGESPDVGEQCLILSPGGELTAGKVLVGLYSDAHPQPSNTKGKMLQRYEDGLEIFYDGSSHALSIDRPGELSLKVKGTHLTFETDKAQIKNKSGELLSLISQALEVITASKTTTMMGPQPSLDNASLLPAIKVKIDSFKSET